MQMHITSNRRLVIDWSIPHLNNNKKSITMYFWVQYAMQCILCIVFFDTYNDICHICLPSVVVDYYHCMCTLPQYISKDVHINNMILWTS